MGKIKRLLFFPAASRVAAIEAALDCDLPPEGTTLTTVRPDMDAFGAMVVLGLRKEADVKGHGAYAQPQIVLREAGLRLEEIRAAKGRIAQIAAAAFEDRENI